MGAWGLPGTDHSAHDLHLVWDQTLVSLEVILGDNQLLRLQGFISSQTFCQHANARQPKFFSLKKKTQKKQSHAKGSANGLFGCCRMHQVQQN